MDKKYLEAFNAILNLVEDLWGVFGSENPKAKKTPLYLYKFLVEKITVKDSSGIGHTVESFKQFLTKYEECILKGDLQQIPIDTVIRYGQSPRAYLEIQKYIYQSRNNPSTVEAIRQHLITISSILEPNKQKLEELERRMKALETDDDSSEAQFIKGIMQDAQDTMGGEDVDMSNPAAAVMTIFQSGVITKMVTGMQEGVSSGRMNPQALMNTMQNMMGTMSQMNAQDAPSTVTDEK